MLVEGCLGNTRPFFLSDEVNTWTEPQLEAARYRKAASSIVNFFDFDICLSFHVHEIEATSDPVTMSQREKMMERLMKPSAQVQDIENMESNIGKPIAACSERVDKVSARTDLLETDLKNMRIEREREVTWERRDSCASAGRKRGSGATEPPQARAGAPRMMATTQAGRCASCTSEVVLRWAAIRRCSWTAPRPASSNNSSSRCSRSSGSPPSGG